MSCVAFALLLAVVGRMTEATTYWINIRYAGTDCSGTPYTITAYGTDEDFDCVQDSCSEANQDTDVVTAEMC
ncbi:hypothetical protein PI124_g12357 [Phytophthora idaei]|nr:hypothetical protein PI125_g11932 [Phytophthora idaei]KAG3151301.1 hypothetical protein PI126_g11080 [Phytophthora idaei]KAG3242828.1 hypothetical protein PI124_g12357 [Phytophthora idaei]